MLVLLNSYLLCKARRGVAFYPSNNAPYAFGVTSGPDRQTDSVRSDRGILAQILLPCTTAQVRSGFATHKKRGEKCELTIRSICEW